MLLINVMEIIESFFTFVFQNHSLMKVIKRYCLATTLFNRLFLNLKNRDGFAGASLEEVMGFFVWRQWFKSIIHC